jgi:hypothetical protein
MKFKITIIIAFATCLAFGQKTMSNDAGSALPLLAAICDTAGIGELVSQTPTNAVISVKQCWFSASPTSTVDVFLHRDEGIPTGGTNFVFFASHYSMDYGPNVPGPYPSMFRMEEVRGSVEPLAITYLMGDGRSLIPVTAENAALISWSSNLVHAAQVSPDMQEFYELIRDGYRLNLESSRIHCDSLNAFAFANYYMPINFMRQIWADTNLIYGAHARIINAYRMETNVSLESNYVRRDDSALPLLAAVCDVIGVGEVESKTGTNAIINVSQLWLGDPQQVRLDVRLDDEELPETGTQFLFFLSKHPQLNTIEPQVRRFEFMFNSAARGRLQTGGLYFLGGGRAVVPATPENSELIHWSSNLVQTSQINPDMQAFYELIRDGYRLNPPASRAHWDSEYAFKHCGYYMQTNFIDQARSDTQLIGFARGGLMREYRRLVDEKLE